MRPVPEPKGGAAPGDYDTALAPHTRTAARPDGRDQDLAARRRGPERARGCARRCSCSCSNGRKDPPGLHVLDPADPAQLRHVGQRAGLARPLFVVSGKSCSTLESNIFGECSLSRARRSPDAKRPLAAHPQSPARLEARADRAGQRLPALGSLGGASAIISASSALQDSLHPAGDVPARPRRAQIAAASRVGRLAEAFRAQPGAPAAHAQIDRHQLAIRGRASERAIGLDDQLARGRAGLGEHLRKRPCHEHCKRDGQQLPRRRLARNRIVLGQSHRHRAERTALNAHPSVAARRVRQPRNPAPANHPRKRPARSRATIRNAPKPGNPARSAGYPGEQTSNLAPGKRSCAGSSRAAGTTRGRRPRHPGTVR